MREPIDHSYEEIRSTVLAILLGNSEYRGSPPEQFMSLHLAVAEVLRERASEPDSRQHSGDAQLSYADGEFVREVFWDLFVQRVITLGSDDCNSDYPHFRLTGSGEKLAKCQQPYFFHDVSSYENIIRTEIPQIDEHILLYLKEAMQAFRSGCILSATVMLGVATESAFLLLLDTIDGNPDERDKFKSCRKGHAIYTKIEAFRRVAQSQKTALGHAIWESLDINMSCAMDLIRRFRNDSGHPSGRIISREQCFNLLHLFIPCCKKIYELIDHFQVELEDEPA